MASIDNKVEDISVFDVEGNDNTNAVIRRSYIPFKGLVIFVNFSCGRSFKQEIFYQKQRHFVLKNQTLSCVCGEKLTFSYEREISN